MSLIALLSLSSSRSPSSSSRSPSSPGRSSKFADFYQRIPFHTKATQRKPNSGDGGAGTLKPQQQQLQLKVYGTNKKSRYRSLLTGFSVDVVERFDRLLAPYSISSSNANSTSNGASHPVLLATSDGLYAPKSSLSLFMDSLHFLPQAAMTSSWCYRKPTMLATSAINDNSSSTSSSSAANPQVIRQIELVALPRRRSVSRVTKHQDQDGTRHKAPTVVIPTRATRRRSSLSSSISRSPVSSRHSKPSELRRAIRANAQLSSALMNKKIQLNETSITTMPTTSNSEISYEINEEELASRFYVELQSHDSRETTSNASGAFTPPKATKVVRFAKEIEDHMNQNDANLKREDEWRARQLDLERQVAALMAENQAKTALIRYLMDENSRIVGDCECGNTVKATISVESPEDEEEIHHHHSNNNNSSCASSGSAQQQEASGEPLAVQSTEPTLSKTELESPVSSPPASPSKTSVQVSSIEVQVAKRKLLETEPHVDQNQNQQNQQSQNQKPAAHEMLFEGLVSEIEAEFSQLFTCESSA